LVKTAKIFIGLILAFLQSFLCAQTSKYAEFAHFNSHNGLPQNEIVGIGSGKNKFIWLGTQNGLARFDGRNFLQFSKTQIARMGSSRISSVIIENNTVLCRTSANNDQWFTVSELSNSVEPIPNKGSEFWLVGADYRIDLNELFSNATNSEDQTLVSDVANKKIENFILVKGSTANQGYFFHNSYLYYYNGTYWRFSGKYKSARINFTQKQKCYFLNQNGTAFCVHSDGSKFDLDKKEINFIAEMFSRGLRFPGVILESQGSLFYHYGNRLSLIETENNNLGLNFICSTRSDLIIKSIFSLGNQSAIFLGTITDGVYIYKKTGFENYSISDNNVFYAIRPYNANEILSPLGVFDKSGNFRQHTYPSRFLQVIENKNKEFLFLSRNYILKNKNFDKPNLIIDSVNDVATGLDIDETGNLYFSGNYGIYLKQNGIKSQVFQLSAKLGKIQSIHCISKNILWIATSNNFLSLDLQTKRLTVFEEMTDKQVRAVFTDPLGNKFLGTYGDGWYLQKQGQKTFQMLPIDKNEYLKIVSGLIVDRLGYLWVSTNNGLFRFFLKDVQNIESKAGLPYYNYFNANYGFKSDEFNGGCYPSAIELSDGKIVFPSLFGLVKADPPEVELEEWNTNIFVDYLLANGQKKAGINNWSLPAGSVEIAFGVSSPYYGNTYNANIQYRLAGKEKAWLNVQENGKIILVDLSAGNYVMQLRHPTGFNKSEFITKEIKFSVAPYWYQTRFLYILILVLSMALVFVFMVRRTQILRKQKIKLRELVNLRTKKIKEQNEALEERIQEVVRNKDALSASNLVNERLMGSLAHDIRSPLKFQIKASEALVNILEKQNNADLIRIAEEIKQNTEGMYHFTGDILAWHMAVTETGDLKSETVNLHDVAQKSIDYLSISALMNQNKIVNKIEENAHVDAVKPIIEIVIRNLLDNANKNTRNGEIMLKFIAENNSCGIEISDNGDGMRAEEVASLNRFYLKQQEAMMPGFGSYMLRDFIKILNADIHYESEAGKGTKVILRCFNTPMRNNES
jgi:signal transduction histidine kinase